MKLQFKSDLGYFVFENWKKYDFFKAAYSTRLGGVSSSDLKSLNFGLFTDDKKENVDKNYEILCKAMNFENVAVSHQIHGTKIIKISKKDTEKSVWQQVLERKCDGMITNEKNITLLTFHADCGSIFAIDPINRAIGLAHAGWRGTVKNIAKNLVEALQKNYNSDPKTLICGLGPCINKCCFEVGEDVVEKFENLDISRDFVFEKYGNKMHLDLNAVNKIFLMRAGVPEENIENLNICTSCNYDILFSYRKTGGKCGRNIAALALK